MHVVSIDPHPSEDSVVCMDSDGSVRFSSKTPVELRRFLKNLAKSEVLVCWDAPLTGPDFCNSRQVADFYWRRIECFFAPQDRVGKERKPKVTRYETPQGISVLPYAGCPHWTITRSLLGLPRVGRFDQECGLPFRLLTEPLEKPERLNGPSVVEFHPAVAAWLWCKDERSDEGWRYKKQPSVRKSLWQDIKPKWNSEWGQCPQPTNDDKFDALVGYILGRLWLESDPSVKLIGCRQTGAWLLPIVQEQDLEAAWEDFLAPKTESRVDVCHTPSGDSVSRQPPAGDADLEVGGP